MVTPKVDDYLKVIYRLQEEDEPVAPSAVATAMGVEPPTVTKMFQRLDAEEFASYERYQGIVLTPRGERRALEVLRHHRLLKLFLTERLGYDWTEVHDEAEVLEHYISEKLERRIAEVLGYPTHDPHGEPIPTVDLELDEADNRQPLAACRQGDVVVVAGVSEDRPTLLSYLGDAGVKLGTTLEVREVAPVGLLSLVVTETSERLSLPESTANHVFVSPLDGATTDENGQFNEVY